MATRAEGQPPRLRQGAARLGGRAWLLVGCLALALLAVLWTVIAIHRSVPPALDAATAAWVRTHRTAALTRTAIGVTSTGSGLPAYLLAAAAGVLAYPRRWWLGASGFVLALLAGQGVRLLLATLLARHRPPTSDWAGYANGPSFPSGHTTTSALVAALVSFALARRFAALPRPALIAVPVAWAVAVGLTRVYLGVHWATDVLGGWLLATALVAVGYGAGRRLL